MKQHPITVGQNGWAPGPLLLKCCLLLGARKGVSSVTAPNLWNCLSPEIRPAPTLLTFWKALKTGSGCRPGINNGEGKDLF